MTVFTCLERFVELAALLLKPPSLLPRFIVIDEPELGLNPASIAQLASMVKMVSMNAHILVATQSTRLMVEFHSDNLMVVEGNQENRFSFFKKLDP